MAEIPGRRTGVVNSGESHLACGDGGNNGAVAGIMVALSVDELMPLAKEIDPIIIPAMGSCAECR
jgi:hypothetical protein